MPTTRHLYAVSPGSGFCQRGCRSFGCTLERQGVLGFCRICEAVYLAARELRERLLDQRAARLHAARPALLDALVPEQRERLLAHAAANSAHRGLPATALHLAGLEDFFAELRDLEMEQLTWQ